MIPPRDHGRAAALSTRQGDRAPAQRVVGVVLCGGRSSRMGRDKAVLLVRGKSMLDRALEALSNVTPDVRIACGANARYAEFGRTLVLDRAPDLGPLGGLQAAFTAGGADYVLAVACDMPRLAGPLLVELLETSLAKDLDVCVLRSARGVEPLCGVWRASMSHAIDSTLASGERRVVAAFEAPLADGSLPRVGFVDVPDVELVRNVNTADDLDIESAR